MKIVFADKNLLNGRFSKYQILQISNTKRKGTCWLEWKTLQYQIPNSPNIKLSKYQILQISNTKGKGTCWLEWKILLADSSSSPICWNSSQLGWIGETNTRTTSFKAEIEVNTLCSTWTQPFMSKEATSPIQSKNFRWNLKTSNIMRIWHLQWVGWCQKADILVTINNQTDFHIQSKMPFRRGFCGICTFTQYLSTIENTKLAFVIDWFKTWFMNSKVYEMYISNTILRCIGIN